MIDDENFPLLAAMLAGFVLQESNQPLASARCLFDALKRLLVPEASSDLRQTAPVTD